MITAIRNAIERRRIRRDARKRYFELSDIASSLLWDEDYSDRKHRIDNLGLLAYVTGAMSREIEVWDDEVVDGRTHAQWHEIEAALYLLVLAAEQENYTEPELDRTAVWLLSIPEIEAALGLLSGRQGVRDLGYNLLDLADAALEALGPNAAEAIAVLAHAYLVSAGLTVNEAHQAVWGINVKGAA
jgi:hypothetical protein